MSRPYQVSLMAATHDRPHFRTNFHYAIPASQAKSTREAGRIAKELALKAGRIEPTVYAVVKGYR